MAMKIETMLSSGQFHLLCHLVMMAPLLVVMSCHQPAETPQVPVYGRYLPPNIASLQDSTLVYAVIEVPAGTAVVQALDTTMEIRPVEERPVDFLPFPGNYGFIAGCAVVDTMDNTIGPLPVMVLMPALNEGSVIAVRPVAVLILEKARSPYPVIIAVPADTALQSIRLERFVDLVTSQDAARSILQHWFLNYRGRAMFEFSGWRDERYAMHLIAQWKITQ